MEDGEKGGEGWNREEENVSNDYYWRLINGTALSTTPRREERQKMQRMIKRAEPSFQFKI